jgi:putative membrane protein
MNLNIVVHRLSAVFFAVFVYQYVIVPWIALSPLFPPHSAFGMLLVVFFAAAHAWYALGPRNAAAFFGLSVLLTWWIEQFGVVSGLVFGKYHYTSSSFMLGDVPYEVPFLWFGLLYLGYAIANAIGGQAGASRSSWSHLAWLSFVGAVVVTGRDAVIEPILARPGVLNRPWVWDESGEYFGVPFQNFVGWILTAFIVYALYRAYERTHPPRPLGPRSFVFLLLPVLFYAGLGLVDLIGGRGPSELPLIAFFAMGLPALLAVAGLVRQRS